MEYRYENLIDESLVNECDQIRSIAKKSWLSSAGVSLATLDNVKATVYNVGLADPRDLKAINLREKNARVVNDQSAVPPLTTVSLQQTAKISGSNSSIPDLIKQQSHDRLQKPTRPASASTRKTRPPSGRKERPQSAKESPSLTTAPNVLIKGAKCEPSGRPPKGVPSGTTTGWVGPPAGLKYPDRPPSGQSWRLEFPDDTDCGFKEAPPRGTPVPPSSSPEPEEQKENKTKRVFELFIGDPYKTAESGGNELFEDSDSDFGSLSPVAQPPPPVLLRKPTPESLRLSLPAAEDEQSDEEMDTERLLQKAEMVTKKLDLQSVFKLNKVTAPTNISSNSEKLHSGSTSQNQGTSVAFSNSNEDSSKLTSSVHHRLDPPAGSGNNKIVAPADSANDNERRLFVRSPNPVFDSFDDVLNDIKIEDEVSTMIGDENMVVDNEFSDHELADLRQDDGLDEPYVLGEEEHNKRKGIIHEHRHKTDLEHEHEKTNVKFSEDKNVTVDITPRNLGRKVTELMPNKKKKAPNDSFVDLIEVKNRIEPILQAGKVAISPRDVLPPKRPPSGKLRTAHSSYSQKSALHDKKQSSVINQRPGSGNMTTSSVCSKLQSGRPRSAPLNRAVSPLTTVLVDYGDEEKTEQLNGENSKTENKPKKRRSKNKEDVETMMQKLGISDSCPIGKFKSTPNIKTGDSGKENDESFKSDDNFAKFDTNTGILTATVCKSEPVKNYYEVARHSSTPNKDKEVIKVEETSPIYKTTKTIEFDESEPKEMSVKTVIDPLLISAKENERLRPATPERGRPASRALSNNVTNKPPIPSEGRSDSLERPGSRRGFVTMAPDKSPSEKKKDIKKRPSSAPISRHQKAKDTKSSVAAGQKDGQTELTEKEKAEREKVIDNLLERTKTLLGEKEETTLKQSGAKKKIRPASAYTGISECKHGRQVKSAGVRRPTSAKTTIHRHTVSAKTPRKSSGKRRTVVMEPCIITTNTSFDNNDETEEDMLCQQMEEELVGKGVNVKAETLQRALYPPTGRTKYYRLTADLPRSNSLTLLSHPKTWLPQEYKRLQKAEKTLSQANEMMYLQHKAELRRAKLAELGPEGMKKIKKRGKKGGKKLRRSNSFG